MLLRICCGVRMGSWSVKDVLISLKGINLSRIWFWDERKFVKFNEPYKVYTDVNKNSNKLNMVIVKPKDISEGEKLPVLVEFHAGGHVSGVPEMSFISKLIAKRKKFVFFSPQYRLAPDYRFPAAPTDCYEALLWVKNHAATYGGDSTKIFITGISAGGNLAAVVTLMSSKDPSVASSVLGQILLAPLTDFRMDSKSYKEAPKWATDIAHAGREMYFPDKRIEDWKDPRASPLLATTLEHVAPAFIHVNTLDPLHDDGVEYSQKLKEAGIYVELSNVVAYHGSDFAMMFLGGYRKEMDELQEKLDNFIDKQLGIKKCTSQSSSNEEFSKS